MRRLFNTETMMIEFPLGEVEAEHTFSVPVRVVECSVQSDQHITASTRVNDRTVTVVLSGPAPAGTKAFLQCTR